MHDQSHQMPVPSQEHELDYDGQVQLMSGQDAQAVASVLHCWPGHAAQCFAAAWKAWCILS